MVVLNKKPLHNWASNGSDAFRYMALSLQEGQDEEYTTVSGDWFG